MEFRILGPLEVVDQGEGVAVGGKRERALLALLLLSAGRVVSSERLAEDLWGGRPPEGATQSLRVYVARLRKALGDAGGVVLTRAPGYVIQVGPEALDAARFEVLLAAGQAQAAGGDHHQATLREALALWRGRVLADLVDAPFARAEAARLEEARLVALEDRIEADLACGRHRELTPELEALTRAHPLRERLWAQRMLALYRAGRQADGLRAYQGLRGLLGEELGIEPSPALRRLEAAILRHEPELDWAPAEVAVESSEALLVPGGERTPFVGRDPERAELRRLLDHAAAGSGGLAMIGGEPGVGKTRLTEELAVEAVRRGLQVFFGHAHEGEGSPPYIAFVEILETALGRAPSPQSFRQALGEEAAEVAKLLPRLRRLCPDLPPPLELPAEQERRLLFNSIREVVARAARKQPILLVLEDLHWADEASLLLLEHLAEQLPELPVLVVGTYRDTELDAGGPLAKTFEDLRRRRLAGWIPLGRLPEGEVAEMLGALSGQEAPAALVRALYAETEGNPFFVEEVFQHLAEEGRLLDAEGRFRTELGELDVPAGVRLAIRRRLQRLGEDTPLVLAAAAVLGRAFTIELLEAMTEFDSDVLLDALEDAERARLIVTAPDTSGEGRYVFAHELIRQTLVADLPLPRHRRFHARAADAMELHYATSLDEHAAGYVHHLLEAGTASDPSRAFHYLILAGRWAMAASAYEEALRHYERALGLRDAADPAERAALLFELGLARRGTGHNDTALEAWRQSLEAYEELGDEEAVGRVCVAASYSLALEIRWADEAPAMCERGLAALGDRVSSDRARLLGVAGVCVGLTGSYQAGADMIDQEIRLAAELEDDAVLGHGLLNQCIQGFGWLEHRTGAEAGLRAAGLLREAGDLFTVATVLGYVALELVYLGRLEELRHVNEELELLAERVGNYVPLMQARKAAGTADFFVHGDSDRLERFGQAHLEEVQRQGLPWIMEGWGYLGVAAFVRGDWEAAQVRFDKGQRGELMGIGKGWNAGPLFECLAYLGARAQALALLEDGRVELPVTGQPNGWGAWCALLAAVEGLMILGEPDRATELYPLTLEAISHTGVVCGGIYDGKLLERAAAMAAMAGNRWEEAEAHFQRALTQAERIPHRPEQAHTRRFYGQMLLERAAPGDHRRATKLLRQATADYRRMAMPRHAAMADGLLARADK